MDSIRRAQRFLAVASLAARIYLGYKAISFRQRYLGLADAEARRSAHHTWCARQIYRLALRLQGPLIKLGQVIGSRPDLVPEEYIAVLSRLQDKVPPRPMEVIKGALRRELKAPEAFFAHLEGEPIAAASWAQVHKGQLRDGRVVAVKVQYPGIEEIVRTDLRNVGFLLRLLNRLERGLDFSPILAEMNEYIPLELDFINEGRNAELIARNFDGRDDVIVPKILWEYTTRRVLTMEYLEGIKISDVSGLRAAGIDPQAVAQLLTETYCEQMYIHGMFNADPHPGNFFVLPGPKLVLLDFGLCRQLSPTFRRNFARLTVALLTGDPQELLVAFSDLGFKTRIADPKPFLLMREWFVEIWSPGRAYLDPERAVEANVRLARVLRNNPLAEYPRELVLIMRASGLLSGLGRILDSRVDRISTTLRYAERAALEAGAWHVDVRRERRPRVRPSQPG